MSKIPELTLEFDNEGYAVPNLDILSYQIFGVGRNYNVQLNTGECDNTVASVCLDIQDCINETNNHYNKVYHYFLKIADEQGLLTKEASLALKPDNWIEWEDLIGSDKFGNKYLINETKYFVSARIAYFDKIINCKCTDTNPNFTTVEQAKQYCQNWLDEHLKNKEVNNEKTK